MKALDVHIEHVQYGLQTYIGRGFCVKSHPLIVQMKLNKLMLQSDLYFLISLYLNSLSA